MKIQMLMSLVVALALTACATTVRQKRLLMTGVGVAAGAAIGASQSEGQEHEALFMASLVGLGAAVASQLVIDDERNETTLKRENEELKRKNDLLRHQEEPKLEGEGHSLLTSPLPRDVRILIRPGGWRRYRLDRWVNDETNENVWYRQTEMFEIIPPSVEGN